MVGHPEGVLYLPGMKQSMPFNISLFPYQVTQLNKGQEPTRTSILVAYDGFSDPREHVSHCIKLWEVVQLPYQFWVHHFIHSLGQIPTAWYIHEEASNAKLLVGKSFKASFTKISYSQVSPLKLL
jgi:hypothetical protein